MANEDKSPSSEGMEELNETSKLYSHFPQRKKDKGVTNKETEPNAVNEVQNGSKRVNQYDNTRDKFMGRRKSSLIGQSRGSSVMEKGVLNWRL